jgi:hypothetical protein
MAKFTITDEEWIMNYPNMAKKKIKKSIPIIFVTVLFILICTFILIKQYLAAVLLFVLFIVSFSTLFQKRIFFEIKAHKIYKNGGIQQEVIFSDENITTIYKNGKFIIDWEGIKNIVRLPTLMFIKHDLLQLYISLKAMSSDEFAILDRKISELKIICEDRRDFKKI